MLCLPPTQWPAARRAARLLRPPAHTVALHQDMSLHQDTKTVLHSGRCSPPLQIHDMHPSNDHVRCCTTTTGQAVRTASAAARWADTHIHRPTTTPTRRMMHHHANRHTTNEALNRNTAARQAGQLTAPPGRFASRPAAAAHPHGTRWRRSSHGSRNASSRNASGPMPLLSVLAPTAALRVHARERPPRAAHARARTVARQLSALRQRRAAAAQAVTPAFLSAVAMCAIRSTTLRGSATAASRAGARSASLPSHNAHSAHAGALHQPARPSACRRPPSPLASLSPPSHRLL